MVLPCLLVIALVSSAEPNPGTSAPAPREAGDSDALPQLSNAMNLALPERERLEAVASLGRLGDPRLLPALGYLMQDRSSAVRLAAVEAVRSIPTEAAQELLVDSARNDEVPRDAREESIRALHRQGLASAPERLERLSRDPRLSPPLAEVARSELQAHYPSRIQAEPEAERAVARHEGFGLGDFSLSGRQTLMAAGAVYGGYSLYALGDLGGTEGGPSLGLIGGATLGGAAGYLLGKDFSRPRSLTLLAGTGLGLWGGVGLGLSLLRPETDRRYLHLFALGGELLGGLATWVAWDVLRPSLEVDNPRADAWFAITGAMLGVPAIHLISQINNDDRRLHSLGATSGLILGSTVGTLLGQRVTDGRGSYLATGTGWSLGLGALGRLAGKENPRRAELELWMLGAGAAGLGLSQLTWSPELKSGDIATLNGFAAGGLVLGTGLALLDLEGTGQGAARVMAMSTAAGLAGGRLLTRHLRFSPGDGGLLGLGLLQGALTGTLLPSFLEPDPPSQHRFAGTLLGASLGTLTAAAVTQVSDYTPGEVGTLFLFDLFGSVAGLGAEMMRGTESFQAIDGHRGVLVGGTISLLAASQLVPRMQLSRGDMALVGLGSAWGLWQGLGLGLGSSSSPMSTGGATLLGFGLGGLTGLGLSQLVEVSPSWVAAAGSGALWGGWLTGSALAAWGDDVEPSDVLLLLGMSDLGLGLTSLMLSPAVGVRPAQVGVASLGGLAGGVLFTLGRGLFPIEQRSLLRASVIGSGVGLLVGSLLASRLPSGNEEEPRRRAAASRSALPEVRFRDISSAPLFNGNGAMEGMAMVARFEND